MIAELKILQLLLCRSLWEGGVYEVVKIAAGVTKTWFCRIDVKFLRCINGIPNMHCELVYTIQYQEIHFLELNNCTFVWYKKLKMVFVLWLTQYRQKRVMYGTPFESPSCKWSKLHLFGYMANAGKTYPWYKTTALHYKCAKLWILGPLHAFFQNVQVFLKHPL